jgi:Tol biopolymer transport system component
MHFVTQLYKWAALGFTIVTCDGFVSFAQTTQPAPLLANIVETGAKPVIFTPGVVTTPADEFAPSFTHDGNIVYFASGSPEIYFSKLVNGKWGKPKVAPFSGKWDDMDPFISPDGKRLFFSSRRPLEGALQDQPQKNAHIWYVDHLSGDNWSAPHHLDAPVNLSGVDNYAPAISRSGTLYFFSPRRDINNKGKSYYAKWLGDHYDIPKVLSLNGSNGVKDPFISPDERYLIFASGNDLYISYRNGNSWSSGQKLGPEVNNGDGCSGPYVSPDGKALYYSQNHAPGIMMIPVHIAQDTD